MTGKRTIPALAAALFFGLALPFAASALNYSGSQGNKATFETLEETRANSPAAVANLETNAGKAFKSHPALDGYPQGTTYVYRSPGMFGGRAAARLNTDILVFTDKSFAAKEAALAYLKDIGAISIVDQAKGSVILVTPADPKAGFGAVDQKNYYALQTAMLAQKASETNGKAITYYSDAEYFGGYGYTYVVGIGGGATFLNNYVAGTLDYVGRIAGMLLIDGTMEAIRQVAALVPAYLVNASDAIVEKYRIANSADSYVKEGALETYFNGAFPLRKVVATKDAKPDAAKYLKDAYFGMFVKAMRVPVLYQGLYTAGTPYQGYGFDAAPYSLCERNAVIDGVTADGIRLLRRSDERFSAVKTAAGEYLQTWFEYLPAEVLNGTAPKGSVPLVLANHGGGDDPRVFVDEIGLLALAGSERFAIVAPEEQYLWAATKNDPTLEICCEMMPRLVRYMLGAYPALDPSRVYVTGYSMGGGATLKTINGDPRLFAGSVVMAASSYVGTAAQVAAFDKVDLPVMFLTSTYDNPAVGAFDTPNGRIAAGFQKQINLFLGYNGMRKVDAFDFASYPVVGFDADRIVAEKLNGEYDNYRWFLDNADGVPMIGVSYTEGLVHALYPEYGRICWDFLKRYSRDQKTGAVKYDPFAK
jgi:pimeloyl-ACP methyl ester carboxylesterase